MKKFNNLIFGRIVACLIPVALMQGCTEDQQLLFDSKTAVITGYLYAGKNLDSIRITQSNSYAGDGIFRTLDSLVVNISEGKDSYILDFIGNGYYQSKNVVVNSDLNYEISFLWNNAEVYAVTYIPKINPAQISDTLIYRQQISSTGGFNPGSFDQSEGLEISWDNNTGDYYFVQVENVEDSAEYIFSFLQELIEEGDTLRRPFIRSEPEIIDFYAINAFRDLQQFGRHRVVVYRLNPEYAAIYEQSGNSSISITAPPTNVENGLGIFTGISTDTLFFEVRKE
ncbi:MAG: DUF4249 family protein [Saprospiraceae bacterium]|nr:DUF4249 family protein [Saprospiraceae bacterium]